MEHVELDETKIETIIANCSTGKRLLELHTCGAGKTTANINHDT